MRRAALGLAPALAALLTLTACGEPATPPPAADAPVERPVPPVTAPVAPPAPPAEPWTSGELRITPGGVGPLSAATPFERAAVVALFPQARVEPGFMHFEDSTWPQIAVEQGDALGLTILEPKPGHREIRVAGGQAVGPNGETLMAKWPDTGFEIGQCAAGEGRDVNALVCRRPNATQIAYVFGVPGWTTGGVPPAATLAEKAFIREIIWTPPVGVVVAPASPAPAPSPAPATPPAKAASATPAA